MLFHLESSIQEINKVIQNNENIVIIWTYSTCLGMLDFLSSKINVIDCDGFANLPIIRFEKSKSF